ncbi:alpha/beta hydrolase [Roseateles sp. PN1]|uniref:alpha/beta hydrolase n=1 Tax=Roseateles sp. PN1 TaxID=3137372 RepID=UPI003139B04D
MPLHPLAADYIQRRITAGLDPVESLSPEIARAQSRAFIQGLPAGPDCAAVIDRHIPGPGGEIPLRIYTPAGAGPFPVCLFFHGGGWVVGDLDAGDASCRMMAKEVGCVVVSVNYRHAPEHKFPAAPEDGLTAAQWVADNAAALNVDAGRLALMGISAGANVVAAVTLMARDRAGPPLACQVLIVPVTDCNLDTPSYLRLAEGHVLTRSGMAWCWQHYLRTPADAEHPLASPLRATSLEGLPPAFITTSEFDPLRDEGESYAARLRDAGVAVTHRFNAGMLHGFHGPEALAATFSYLRAELFA